VTWCALGIFCNFAISSQAQEQLRLRKAFVASGPVYCVALSPDGKTLASASGEVIEFFDPKVGGRRTTLKGHTDTISSVSFSPDGKLLASGSWDGTIKLWEVATGLELSCTKLHSDDVTAVTFSPDGKKLVSISYTDGVKLYNLASGRTIDAMDDS